MTERRQRRGRRHRSSPLLDLDAFGHEDVPRFVQVAAVGIDRSVTARRAAEAAAELAIAHGANLHIVMCVERTSSVDVSVGGDRFHADWLTDADQFLDAVGWKLQAPSITRTVGLGDPASMLCEEAQRLQARTIVVGNRRVRAVSRVLGSVASDVTRRSPCDVLVAQTCRGTAS